MAEGYVKSEFWIILSHVSRNNFSLDQVPVHARAVGLDRGGGGGPHPGPDRLQRVQEDGGAAGRGRARALRGAAQLPRPAARQLRAAPQVQAEDRAQ